MQLKIIYEDENVLAIDKPANIIVFPEGKMRERTLIDLLLEKFPNLKNVGKAPRYGMVHRLDKDTSGILLIAKNDKTLIFLQKEFKKQKVEKKYLALVVGQIKENFGVIETLIGRSKRDKRKQKVYLPHEPGSIGKKKAKTCYKTLKRFKNYTLVEVSPKTGKKHQIRTHLAYIGHPVAGDKMYGFKGQLCPKGLERQFLHASYLKIKLPNRKEEEFKLELPDNLKKILSELRVRN